MKIPFANKKGEVIFLDSKLTIADLVKMGISVEILPWGLPATESMWVHVPPRTPKKQPEKKP